MLYKQINPIPPRSLELTRFKRYLGPLVRRADPNFRFSKQNRTQGARVVDKFRGESMTLGEQLRCIAGR